MLLSLKKSTLLLLFCSFNLYASQEITANHVYQEALKLKAFLYNTSDIKSELIQRIKISSAQPLHVYAIASALNEKVAILSSFTGKNSIIRPKFPSSDIQPKHVLALVLAIQQNLLNLKTDNSLSSTSNSIKGKKPVDVLRIILACNLLIDRLIDKQLTPEHPMFIAERIKYTLSAAIKASNKVEPDSQFAIYNNVEPRNVFANAEILFKTLSNTTRLRFNVSFPQRPFYLPYQESDIKPIHVFTVSTINEILLKNLIRRSGYPVETTDTTKQRKNTTPGHVYAAYEQILFLTRFFIR
jgi:hypothetical protein